MTKLNAKPLQQTTPEYQESTQQSFETHTHQHHAQAYPVAQHIINHQQVPQIYQPIFYQNHQQFQQGPQHVYTENPFSPAGSIMMPQYSIPQHLTFDYPQVNDFCPMCNCHSSFSLVKKIGPEFWLIFLVLLCFAAPACLCVFFLDLRTTYKQCNICKNEVGRVRKFLEYSGGF